MVDKSLNLNLHLGLIRTLFPHAAIIKINRQAPDNAWSCYRTFFNQGQSWSYNLADIKHYFQQEAKLNQHWQTLFGDSLLEVNYEDLVQQPETSIRLCLEHIGLNYQAKLLEFYQSKQLVQTASVGQVRQAINTKSIGIPASLAKYFTDFL